MVPYPNARWDPQKSAKSQINYGRTIIFAQACYFRNTICVGEGEALQKFHNALPIPQDCLLPGPSNFSLPWYYLPLKEEKNWFPGCDEEHHRGFQSGGQERPDPAAGWGALDLYSKRGILAGRGCASGSWLPNIFFPYLSVVNIYSTPSANESMIQPVCIIRLDKYV